MSLTRSAFDCEYYAIEVGRLELDAADPDLDDALAKGQAAGFNVLFLRVPAQEKDSLATLVSRGLEPLETLVTSTLARAVPLYATSVVVEESERAAVGDLAAISAMTAEAIQHSHLHADPRLPRDQTCALYAAWARNDATGRAQRIFVAREAGEVAGYLSVVIANANAMIDLVVVRAASRGHGIGSELLTRFLTWHATTTLTATVGTQADNPALALYHRFGFDRTHVHLSYHVWLGG